MSDFKAFMVGRKDEDVVEVVASNRMLEPELDKGGKPIVLKKGKDGEPDEYKMKPAVWKIKAITSDLDELLRKECTKKVPIFGKRGQYTQETDNDKYIAKMCAASIVHPNLKNVELQDFYGVKSEDALLKEMLLPGEYSELKIKIMEVNGYDMSMDELVDEAKN